MIGAISEVEGFITGNVQGCRAYLLLPAKEITMAGFLVTAHLPRVPEAMQQLGSMLKAGQLRSAETLVPGSFLDWASCMDTMLSGKGFGRMVLQVTSSSDSKL